MPGWLSAVPPLIEALQDPEARWSAVEALGHIGDLQAAPALSELLEDPAPDVRIEVIQALGHFNHPQMIDFVRNVAKKERNHRRKMNDYSQEKSVHQFERDDPELFAHLHAAIGQLPPGEPAAG